MSVITLDQRKPVRIGMHGGIGMLSGEIAFDNSYPTGGEDLNLNDYFQEVYACIIENTAGYIFEYDKDNDLVKALYPTSVTAGSGTVNDALGFSTGSDVFKAANNAHHGVEVGSEVANTTDLSGLTAVRFMAFGRVSI